MPAEINGLLNHNISSGAHPLPFQTFDHDGKRFRFSGGFAAVKPVHEIPV
jgi:hypothetical protein